MHSSFSSPIPNPSPAGFVSWVEASLRSDPPRQAGDAVDLVTFHRAKGLEWRVVFVTGLEDGLVPIAHARSTEALAEEQRLLYVACTRAMDDLHCSWARERSFGGRRSARTPSPYLAAIEATHRDLARLAEVTPDRCPRRPEGGTSAPRRARTNSSRTLKRSEQRRSCSAPRPVAPSPRFSGVALRAH